MIINAKTKKLAVIGNPIVHSLSCELHNYISEKMHLNYAYMAFEPERNRLSECLEGIKQLGFSGVNITSPFKKEALLLCDFVSEKAKRYGSVNTIVNKNGVLYGYNTDADGLYMSLKRNAVNVKGKNILFIGAGGVTRPAIVNFFDNGAEDITVINRTKSKVTELKKDIKKLCNKDIKAQIKGEHYDIVINTTTVGMYPDADKLPVDNVDFVDGNTMVIDMIYNPPQTKFLHECEKKGALTVNGLGMLIYQGMLAYGLFTGVKPDEAIYDGIEMTLCKALKGKGGQI